MTARRMLGVCCDVKVDIGDQQVTVCGDGSDIVVEVPSLTSVYRVMRQLRRLAWRKKRLSELSGLLQTVGLTLVVRTPSRKLISLGIENDSMLLRLFGVRNARLHLS
ncbi:hypothetical protein [Fuerstiella marisgermanici]|nr:hypothetical protein [Fuerstiella marisgermanici]